MTDKPEVKELSPPDDGMFGTPSAYLQLLLPQDTVLMSRGRDYRTYREVLRDDQCKSTYQQRRDAVVSAAWEVEPASESAADVAAADALRENLQAIEFDRITSGMHTAVWYGHAVGECMWGVDAGRIVLMDVRVRERQRFAYDVFHRLFLRSAGRVDELMPERKFWTLNTGADHDDEPYGLGLAHYCYWPVFFKRNDIKFWLVFQEKFAAPTVMGKAPGAMLSDQTKKDAVLQQLRAFANDTAIVVPEGVEVTLLEAARSGSNSYKELCDAMDAAISKIVLSQTMTTDNGSSRSQSEVHESVRDLVVKSDADLICNSFNRGPAKWLTEWNFPGAKPPRVWRNLEPDEDLNKRAERDAKVYTLGFEPTEEYITEHYGEGWQKRAMESGMTPNEVASQAAAEFAELGVIAAAKGARRQDQQELVEGARRYANRYRDINGKRVGEIVNFAESSGDYETMRRHLLEMMSQSVPPEMAAATSRSGILANLLGRFRAQR